MYLCMSRWFAWIACRLVGGMDGFVGVCIGEWMSSLVGSLVGRWEGMYWIGSFVDGLVDACTWVCGLICAWVYELLLDGGPLGLFVDLLAN